MLKLAPNISTLFSAGGARARIEAVARAGFRAFEFLQARSFDLEELDAARREHGMTAVLLNLESGDGVARRGYLAQPECEEEWLRSLDEGLEVARRLGVGRAHVLCGWERPEVGRERQRDLVVERLRRVAPMAADAGVTLLLEGLNTFDNPGYFLHHSWQGFEIVELVGHPNVRFQYDLYHMYQMEGNLGATVEANLSRIGHMQLADVPGRHEPGTGEINYPNVLRRIDAAGYTGYIGLEYRPIATDPFAWIAPIRDLLDPATYQGR